MTTALEGGEGSASRPGRSLPPGKTGYPLYRRLGGPQGRSEQLRKISPPTGIRSSDRPGRSQSLYWLRYLADFQFSIILNSMPRSHNWSITCRISVSYFVISNTRATCPSRPILLNYISQIVPTKQKKKLLIASFWNYLQTLASLLPVRNVVSMLLHYLWQKNTVLSILIFKFKTAVWRIKET
jgi:hypothetical protein